MLQEGRCPISGYAYLLGGAISWSAKRQDIVTLLTTEAEYIALTHASKEAIWLKNLLGEIFPWIKFLPVTINCDNQGAIALTKDDCFHSRMKHIDIRFHFIRESIEKKEIKIIYTALPMLWSRISSQKDYRTQRPNTLPPRWGSARFEGEC